MKRIFELGLSDIMSMDKSTLLKTIETSEGRTVVAENVVSTTSHTSGVSNPELSAAFGADMITLNGFSFERPFIFGYDDEGVSFDDGFEAYGKKLDTKVLTNLANANYIQEYKKIVGRFLGVNMEPVQCDSTYNTGLTLNENNLKKAKEYGFDYIVLTGNPNTGVTGDTILDGIKLAKNIVGDDMLIVAGKMHGAGSGNIYDEETIGAFVDNGADIVLLPAPGTVPGFTIDLAKELINLIHKKGALTMTTFGTSQESSKESLIENVSIMSKMAGSDIQHIGDAGISGMCPPENIMAMSVAVRGRRHTFRRMGYSINR